MDLDQITQGALNKKRAQTTATSSPTSQGKKKGNGLEVINPMAHYKPSVYVDPNHMEMADGTMAVRKEIIISPSIKGKDYLKWKERIERQIEIGEKLHHPHHTSLLHHEKEGRVYNLFYKLAPGKNLRDLVQEKSLTTDDILTITEQVASALDHGHNLRPPVLHNDITPSNVHYDIESKHATLYDHDAATAEYLDENHFTTRVLGTDGYVSPEVKEGEMPTSKSDVYGLGCLLKHMLTGENPNKVKDRTLKRRGNNDQLVELVHKMIEVNPNNRPTASEVVSYIERIRNGVVEEKRNSQETNTYRQPVLPVLLINGIGIGAISLFAFGSYFFSDRFDSPKLREFNQIENQIEIEYESMNEVNNFNEAGNYDVSIREGNYNYINENKILAPGLYEVSEGGELKLVNENKIYDDLTYNSIPNLSGEDLFGLSVFNLASNDNFDLMMKYSNIPKSGEDYNSYEKLPLTSQSMGPGLTDVSSDFEYKRANYEVVLNDDAFLMMDLLSLMGSYSNQESSSE